MLRSVCIAICMTTPLRPGCLASAPLRASQAPAVFLAPDAGLAWAGWGWGWGLRAAGRAGRTWAASLAALFIAPAGVVRILGVSYVWLV